MEEYDEFDIVEYDKWDTYLKYKCNNCGKIYNLI
jgi:hypothetical protein